jgi:Glycosyltransferase family 87
LALGIVGVALVPTLAEGLVFDNLSVTTIGLTIGALVLWPRTPWLAGVMLGLGLAIKPTGLLAFVALVVHRPTSASTRHWATGAIALGTAGLVLAPAWRLALELLTPPATQQTPLIWATALGNVSLFRVLIGFGLHPFPYAVPALLTVSICLGLRLRPIGARQLVYASCAVSILALPVVWKHTLLLVFPIQCMALLLAGQRLALARRADSGDLHQSASKLMLLQLLLVVAAILAVFEAEDYGRLAELAPWATGALLLVPLTGLVALTVYVLRVDQTPGIGARLAPKPPL